MVSYPDAFPLEPLQVLGAGSLKILLKGRNAAEADEILKDFRTWSSSLKRT